MFFNFSVGYIFLIHTGFLLNCREEHFNLNIMASLYSENHVAKHRLFSAGVDGGFIGAIVAKAIRVWP
jgi:hypothetical protein